MTTWLSDYVYLNGNTAYSISNPKQYLEYRSLHTDHSIYVPYNITTASPISIQINPQQFTSCFNLGKTIMNIGIEHTDESENELDVELCCELCDCPKYGLTPAQYYRVHAKCKEGKIANVPLNIDTPNKLIAFIASL